MGINQASFSGNLTREPDIRKVGDLDLMNFGIAVNVSQKGQDGNWTKVPFFLNCSIIGGVVPYLAQSMHKGTLVCVSGSFFPNNWTDKDGNQHHDITLRCNEVVPMRPAQTPPQPQQAAYTAPNYQTGVNTRVQNSAPVYASPQPAQAQNQAADTYAYTDIPF